MNRKKRDWIGRTSVFLIGIVLVSAGIVLCKKSGLGISPISSIPFVMEELLPLSFGTLTMLFHFLNTLIQIVLEQTELSKKLLQIPLAFVFGSVIDLIQKILCVDITYWFWQIFALCGSVIFTAFGMICMLSADLVQNPPDGTVKVLSRRFHIELGKIKNGYDVICVICSVAIGICFLKKIKGFGVATIVSAIFVGRCITWMQAGMQKIKQMN